VSTHQFAYPQKRRSTRIDQAIPLVVQGVGALREPYQEQVSTLSISCHGCSYQSKHEVIQGETVYLDIKAPADGAVGYSGKARVKWAQKLGAKERSFQIAVELESAGNVWGVATPPDDWFPLQISKANEPAPSGRELKVVARKEQQVVTAPDAGSDQVSQLARSEVAVAPIQPFAQLMAGLGEQIQTMASEAAAAALVKEKGRLLEEFRAQIREEAVKTIQSVISASKDVIVHQAMKELSEANETAARDSHALWRKQIVQDLESARQHMLTQGKEVGQRLDAMAVSTIERVQSSVDTTRSEAVDRFVSRIRDQIAPMLEVAKDSLQRLQGAESALRKESEAIFAGIENQLAFSTNESLAKALEELEKNAAVHTAKTNEILAQLYQNFENTAKNNVESLLASLGSQVTGVLQEKAAEVSREFSTGLEVHTRGYLESIGKSITEITQNMPGHSRQ
jgi:hypothetical protein